MADTCERGNELVVDTSESGNETSPSIIS
jgi:hypothetical protein